MFKADTKISKELIETFDDEEGVFYRFQNSKYNIKGEHEQSWDMIFSSAVEFRKSAEEWGLYEDEAVLPEKSCIETLLNTSHVHLYPLSEIPHH